MSRKQAAVWCCLLELSGCCSGSGAIMRHTHAAWLDSQDAATCARLLETEEALNAFHCWIYVHVLTHFNRKVN